MLVEYVKPNVLTLPVTGKKGEMLKNVQLAPGINQVAKKDWDICKDLPKIKRLVADKKIKVSLAILGGGDIVFPLILAGVVMSVLGLIQAAIVSVFAALSLLLLFVFAKKDNSSCYQ